LYSPGGAGLARAAGRGSPRSNSDQRVPVEGGHLLLGGGEDLPQGPWPPSAWAGGGPGPALARAAAPPAAAGVFAVLRRPNRSFGGTEFGAGAERRSRSRGSGCSTNPQGGRGRRRRGASGGRIVAESSIRRSGAGRLTGFANHQA